MATRPYHQETEPAAGASAPSAASTATRLPVPRPLRWLVAGLVVYILLLVALPLQMTLGQDALAASIRENRPDLNPARMDFAIAAALIYSWVLHAIVVALAIWFVARAVRGRRWARIALTFYLVAALPLSAISVAAGTMFLWAAIAGDAIQVVMLALLWMPPSVRRFFAVRRAEAVE